MSGDATFAGTNYQAGVIAHIYVHLLAHERLRWSETADDTPLAVTAETRGPGDDVRVEFSEQRYSEVQAKHTLSAGAEFDELIASVADKTRGKPMTPVYLIVSRGASKKLYLEYRANLDRLRAGRPDAWSKEFRAFVDRHSERVEVLAQLHIRPVDIDQPADPEAYQATQILSQLLTNPEQAAAAWAALFLDAAMLCARRLRRTRSELVAVLEGKGIKVGPPLADARWQRELDFISGLLKSRHNFAALNALKRLEHEIGERKVDRAIRYRISAQRATALLGEGRAEEALICAKMALDYDPESAKAYVLASTAALTSGDVESARTYAENGLAGAPSEPSLWGAAAQVAYADRKQIPEPPPMIAEALEYRLALLDIAIESGDTESVLQATAALLASGSRRPELLFARANALLMEAFEANASDLKKNCDDVKRLVTEVIDACSDDLHPLSIKSLVLRSSAHRLLGENQKSDDDLNKARALAANDPDALRIAALRCIEHNDFEGAAALLKIPAAEDVPQILALRSTVKTRLGDAEGAHRDLSRAVDLVRGRPFTPAQERYAVVDAALRAGDAERAESVLATIGASQEDQFGNVLRGRIAFLRGQVEDGVRMFRLAAGKGGALREEIVRELAVKLIRAQRPADAAHAVEELGDGRLRYPNSQVYADALWAAAKLVDLKDLLTQLATVAPLPVWALRYAVNLALRQGDNPEAARHLLNLITYEDTDANRMLLANCLVCSGLRDDAKPHLDVLGEKQDLPALERLRVAQLLVQVGEQEKAKRLAYSGFREARHIAEAHRLFIAILLQMSDAHSQVPSEIGPDTYFVMVSEENEQRETLICSSKPIDPLRNEVGVEEAGRLGFLGKRLGETIFTGAGTWKELKWVVIEIKDAVTHCVQDAIRHFEERFPSEPFFIGRMRMGDGSSVKDLAPLISVLHGRSARTESVLALYREKTLPLGTVAQLLGADMGDLVADITGSRISPNLWFQTEWQDDEGQSESVSAALAAKEVALTRSALIVAHECGILDKLKRIYTLICPQSMLEELGGNVRSALERYDKGANFLRLVDGRLSFVEAPPRSVELEKRLNLARTLHNWVIANVNVEPRPLRALEEQGVAGNDLSEVVGASSADAVSLTRYRGATVYADDLGLRRFFGKNDASRSFSTIGLLRALGEKGVLTSDERDRMLLGLLGRRHAAIPVTEALLRAAIRTTEPRDMRAAFALLGGPSRTIKGSAHLAAQVARAEALAPIQTCDTRSIVNLALDAMQVRWPPRLCAAAISREIDEEMRLIPHALVEAKGACADFVRAQEESAHQLVHD